MQENPSQTARLATMAELRKTLLASHLCPVPCTVTLRNWFDRAAIPRFKCNATALRGGGLVYYQVSAVEKFLRSRMLPGKAVSL